MKRVVCGVLILVMVGLSGLAQTGEIDVKKLERIREMSPEKRKNLLEAVRRIKELPKEERERLRENSQRFRKLSVEEQKKLQAKARQLDPKEKALYHDLAVEFNGTLDRRERAKLQGFPRVLFFTWLREARPADFDRIKDLSPGQRKEAFWALCSEFSIAVRERIHHHVRQHRCISFQALQALSDPETGINWRRWQEFVQTCRAERARDVRRKPPTWH